MLGTRAHRVGIRIGEMAMQFADVVAVVATFRLGLGGGQFCLQATQGDVAVDRVFDSRAIECRGFLSDIGHAPFAGVVDLTLVGMQFATQNGEQAGFAGAIGTDEADFVTGIEGKVDILQQGLNATC